MVFGEVSVLAVEPDGRDGCGELCDVVGVVVGFYADEGSAGVLCGVEVLVGFLNPVQCCVGRWRQLRPVPQVRGLWPGRRRPCSEGLGFRCLTLLGCFECLGQFQPRCPFWAYFPGFRTV